MVAAGAPTASIRSRTSCLVCRKRRPGAGIHLEPFAELRWWAAGAPTAFREGTDNTVGPFDTP